MDDNDKNFFDLSIPLISNQKKFTDLKIKDSMLTIIELIKLKYLNIENIKPLNISTTTDLDFISIKDKTKKISDMISETKLKINQTIINQVSELNKLHSEKKLLNQNQILSDIIENQKLLIESLRQNTIELKSKSNNNKKKLEVNIHTNRTLKATNNELNNTISDYIQNNKKLKDDINKLKSEHTELLNTQQINEINDKVKFYYKKILKKKLEENIHSNKKFKANIYELNNTIGDYIQNNKKLKDDINKLRKEHTIILNTQKIDEKNDKIKFYQEENVRLSSELNTVQGKYQTIKNNFAVVELDKNNIYKQIQELNNSLIKNNIVGSPFVKDIIKENSINSKVLNDISNINLQEDNKILESKNILDDDVNDLFK